MIKILLFQKNFLVLLNKIVKNFLKDIIQFQMMLQEINIISMLKKAKRFQIYIN
ncbi:hypothetical protein XFF6991_4932 [Xanthomonas phaseoli pv. phaseoli]|uniref:Uncharacterized protein n=1 Tax=Xanthomonas campestris pv. phaseoli TaxID=317013 RepID=A0A7Z7IXT2_XANCH|nr:hypothetical protein XFF6991_4932 [Xanthomonas phaseoli pv. phaseoli]